MNGIMISINTSSKYRILFVCLLLYFILSVEECFMLYSALLCFALLELISFYCRLYQKKAIKNGIISDYLQEVNTAPMRVFLRVDITECQLCTRPFSLFSRKHHCRSCGKCVW